MADPGDSFVNSCVTMFSAAMGGTVALAFFAVITIVVLLACCFIGIAILDGVVDEMNDQMEWEQDREPPPRVTPVFPQPEPGQHK